MQRSAQHSARLLVCAAAAALPVTFVAACSSGSAAESDAKAAAASSSASASPSPSPTLAKGKFAKLPDACSAIPQKTVKSLVPKAKSAKGEASSSSDTNARSGCSWNGLNGYQYRWLDVSFQRYDSVQGIGSADSQAVKHFQQQVGTAEAAAKGATATTTSGVGDQATTVTAKVTKDKEDYQQVTVVTRTANAVIVLNYNGAGFENAKNPSAADLQKDAVSAAKETVAAVAAANT
jgi:hypothetical protein